jgi:hypothetical protein
MTTTERHTNAALSSSPTTKTLPRRPGRCMTTSCAPPGPPQPPVWLQSLGHSAALARAYWERAKGTLFSGNLPLPLKEMIVFVVSARARRAATAPPVTRRTCSAWTRPWPSHDSALSSWQSDSRLQAARAATRVSSRFATKVVADANGLGDEDFEELMDEGFTREEIMRDHRGDRYGHHVQRLHEFAAARPGSPSTAPSSDPRSAVDWPRHRP